MRTELFFDLYQQVLTNGKFRDEISGLMNQFITLEMEQADKLTLEKKLQEIIRACDYNPGILVPYFYPKFPEDKPMTLWTRPHAFAMLSLIFNGTITVAASRQIGKCISGDSKLNLMQDGVECTKTIEELFQVAKSKLELCS